MRLLQIILSAVVALPVAVTSASAEEQASTSVANNAQSIRVDVNRVSVDVVVTDEAGKFVEGLQRGDFHVFDNGMEQPISDFFTVDEPARVLLLVEAGPAVYLLQRGHLQAAHALMNGLSPEDSVAIAKYDEAPEGLLDFTPDKQAAAATLDGLRFNLGFGSLNLSSSIEIILGWLDSPKLPSDSKQSDRGALGKRTIVLLSSGLDTSPENKFRALQSRLKTGDVRILAVSLTGGLQVDSEQKKTKNQSQSPKVALTAKQFTEAAALLKEIAESSGGHAYFPSSSKEFAAVFAEIAQIVRHEFSLAFVPPVNDGAVHSIEVRVVRAQNEGPSGKRLENLRVDYRRAYQAPSAN